ncbi:MAG: META domain-containing protein [Bacteroidota bacterium]
MLLRLFLLALALSATGCDDENLENDLVGVGWALREIALPPGDSTALAPASIRFTSDTAVEIESCNRCEGRIGRASNELDFSLLGCTERACPSMLDLGPRLGAADRVAFSLSDDGLLLIADRDDALSIFRFEAE